MPESEDERTQSRGVGSGQSAGAQQGSPVCVRSRASKLAAVLAFSTIVVLLIVTWAAWAPSVESYCRGMLGRLLVWDSLEAQGNKASTPRGPAVSEAFCERLPADKRYRPFEVNVYSGADSLKVHRAKDVLFGVSGRRWCVDHYAFTVDVGPLPTGQRGTESTTLPSMLADVGVPPGDDEYPAPYRANDGADASPTVVQMGDGPAWTLNTWADRPTRSVDLDLRGVRIRRLSVRADALSTVLRISESSLDSEGLSPSEPYTEADLALGVSGHSARKPRGSVAVELPRSLDLFVPSSTKEWTNKPTNALWIQRGGSRPKAGWRLAQQDGPGHDLQGWWVDGPGDKLLVLSLYDGREDPIDLNAVNWRFTD